MYEIKKATKEDASDILHVTKKAFGLYKNELHSPAPVTALSETIVDIITDIEKNTVFIAKEKNVVLGAIRFCKLSDDLCYIYRFAVDPDINNTGIGSDLLNTAIETCKDLNMTAIALHTNSKYYRLARYYYGKQFFVHSTDKSKGYIRALFIKELKDGATYDIIPALFK